MHTQSKRRGRREKTFEIIGVLEAAALLASVCPPVCTGVGGALPVPPGCRHFTWIVVLRAGNHISSDTAPGTGEPLDLMLKAETKPKTKAALPPTPEEN